MPFKSKIKVCKKCHKELPSGYKHKYCEACLNQWVQDVKKGAIKGGIGLAGIVLLVITGGRIKINK